MMTIDEARAMDCLMLTPAQAASLIGCDPQGLRMTAREDPQSLGFPVVVIGNRVKIPRVPLIRFLGG